MYCPVVLPTFFPGPEIYQNLKSIPITLKILIIDNSNDETLREKIKNHKNCEYYNIGDAGLGKTFNFALKKVQTEFMLLTQPDVVLRDKCIENLLNGMRKYPNAGICAPVVYDNGVYSKYDFYDLKYDKIKKKFNYQKLKNKIYTFPSGDYCVDAINATTMLIRVKAIKDIGGWDDDIYVYLEDIDISLRMNLANYRIIKILDAVVDHMGWSSHFSTIKNTMNVSRIWHFTWSSLYFQRKFCNKILVYQSVFGIIFLCILKNLFHLITFNLKKFKINNIKISACLSLILNRGSYFRVKHNV